MRRFPANAGLARNAETTYERRKTRKHQENPFGDLVSALDHQDPDGDRGQGHGDVLADPEDLHAAGDAGKFRGRVADVGDEQAQEDKKGDLDTEAFADQVGQPLAGDDTHAGIHLLDHQQNNEGRQQGPEQPIAVVRTGNRVGGDAAGVIVDAAGDDARAQDA